VKDPRIYLARTLECLDRVGEYTNGGRAEYDSQSLIRDAVIRNFEIIGKASKRVPEESRGRHPQIPWRGLAGFRDVLIHQYEGVDHETVWRIIEHELPAIRAAILKVLPPLEQLERELNGGPGPA
jgi:uncharacterized protein with HEPN domain